MPEFVNPFSGMAPDRKMTNAELIRALRLNIAAEEEAIHLYEAHAVAFCNIHGLWESVKEIKVG